MSNLGKYTSIAQVWLMHPNGGQPGDFVELGYSDPYATVYWDEITNTWGDSTEYPNQTPHDAQLQDLYDKVDALKRLTIHLRGYYDNEVQANTFVTAKKAGDIAYIKNALSSTGYYTATLVNGAFVEGTVEAPSPEVDLSLYQTASDVALPTDTKTITGAIREIYVDLSALTDKVTTNLQENNETSTDIINELNAIRNEIDAIVSVANNCFIISYDRPLAVAGINWVCTEDGVKYTFIDSNTPIEL